MKKRVVITGMDVTSSVGSGLNVFWEALVNGVCGIRKIQSYDASSYSTQIGGEVPDFNFSHVPELDKPKRYPKVAQYALYCAHGALQMAGLTQAELPQVSTYMGTGMGGMPELESGYKIFFNEGAKKIPALSVIRGMSNSVANFVAIAFGLGGANSTYSNACVSSAEAIGNAYQQIAFGNKEVALCGGTESMLWESIMAAWCKLRVMSTQNENPSIACRPFERDRDGMVISDGAGVVILEELEHAKARGATIYAEIIGFGTSCDAFHITVPKSDGQVRAIHNALDDARISPNDVQYINAHGTGTLINDSVETETIKSVFKEHAYSIPITAQKSMTGHAIGAAGVLDIISTAMALKNGILPPTINLNNPDPACDLDYIPNVARQKQVHIALSNHFAFGGANAAMVLQRYE